MSLTLVILSALAVTMTNSALSPTQEQELVTVHNTLRRSLAKGLVPDSTGTKQPSSGDMRELRWSSTLATAAQQWAAGCVFAHSSGHSAGENIAQGTAGYYNQTTLAGMWFAEISVVNPPHSRGMLGLGLTNCRFASTNVPGQIGHYTQAIWATTSQVGCGAAECSGNTLLVCQYADDSGKGGNIINQPIYNHGAPCQFCEGHCDDGLCTVPAPVTVGGCKGEAAVCTRQTVGANGVFNAASLTACSVMDQVPTEVVAMVGANDAVFRSYETMGFVVTITYTVSGGNLAGYGMSAASA